MTHPTELSIRRLLVLASTLGVGGGEKVLASLLRGLRAAGVSVHEAHLDLDALGDAQEAFFTSTTRDIVPVRAVDGHLYDAPGPVTRALVAAYQALIESSV